MKIIKRIFMTVCLFIGLNNYPVTASDTVQYQIYKSAVIGEDISYKVAVPASFAEGKKSYPLLVVLDAYKQFNHTVATSEYLSKAGQVPELVIVGINSNNRLRDFSPSVSSQWFGKMGGAPKFLEFLETELLPKITKKYNIRKEKILMGHSAGGLFTAYALTKQPSIFDAYFILDANLDWDEKYIESNLSKTFQQGLGEQKYLHFDSSFQLGQDPKYNVFRSLELMLKKEAPGTLRWSYHSHQDETHSSITIRSFMHALKGLYDGWFVHDKIMFEGLDAVTKHYADRQHRVGAHKQPPENALITMGYLLMGQDTKEAIKAFTEATRLYPTSFNSFDSLSDGLAEIKDLQGAIQAAEKAFLLAKEQNSDQQEYISKKIKELQKGLISTPSP